MIELRDLSKTYYQGHVRFAALTDINLTIDSGEIFGIIGRSGAGKSTLVQCMNLLERPDTGQVIVNGQDLAQLNGHALRLARRNIGKIFQHFNLLQSRNVYQNIALPLELIGKSKKAIAEQIEHLLELVGLTEHKHHLPHELSGGQKQRVAIARALAAKPAVLLCDEATSALDPETTTSILQLLKSINDKLNITIVLITHEMEVVKQICHRMAVLDQGKCVEQGEVLNLFAKPKHQTTKALLSNAIRRELPPELHHKLHSQPTIEHPTPVVRLIFVGEEAKQPIINDLHNRFQVDSNILQADLQWIDQAIFGISIIQIQGSRDNCQQALDYLHNHQITTEVLGYV